MTLGFAVVLVLLIAVGVTSYRGLQADSTRLAQYDESATTALLSTDLERVTANLQRGVQTYIHTGLPGLVESTRDLSSALSAEIESLHERVRGPELRTALERMLRHLEAYARNFEDAVVERALRNELVHDRMSVLADEATAALAELSLRAGNHALVNLLRARHSAMSYHDRLDAQLVDEAKRQLATCRAELAKQQGDVPLDAEGVARARVAVDDYETAFLRSVQATRAYLYLVNVVMAGESAEFAHQAAKLRQMALAEQNLLHANAAHEASRLLHLDLGLITLAVLLGMFSSWAIGLTIVRPLRDMTSTFKALASGRADLNIPGLDRRDELGEMASAAEIFRKKNAQTEQLLSQSRELSTELAAKQEQLENSNAELEQVMYTVSHDLKSPLVTSLGLIGMIRDMAARGQMDKAVSQLDRLERPNRRMSTLISDFLSFSRVGRVDAEHGDVELGPLVSAVLDELRVVDHMNTLDVEVAEDLPTVRGNSEALQRVFENLLTNAMKYASTSDDTRVEIGFEQHDDHALVFVRDHGPGIPLEYHARVFELFQRLETDQEGTGVGLAIVDRVMKHHSGDVRIEPTPGGGATFWLRFPQPQLLAVT